MTQEASAPQTEAADGNSIGPAPAEVNQEDIKGNPGQSGTQPTGQAGEDWKQGVQSQRKSQNESAGVDGGYAPLSPASQVLDRPETPSSDSSPHVPAFIPEPAVKTVGGASPAAQQGAAAPVAYGASTKGSGNQAGPDHLATAEHAPTDNHTREYEGDNSA